MTRLKLTLVMLSAFAGLALLGTDARAEGADGKTIFTTMKCNMCHTVDSASIAQIKDEEEGDDGEASKPKDLSDTGATHDAKWMKDWLMKKAELNGKTHRKKFTGTPEELDALATWLASLKASK